MEEAGSEPAARGRAADCSYCLPSMACRTHMKTAAQGDWCSENNKNRNIEVASEVVMT